MAELPLGRAFHIGLTGGIGSGKSLVAEMLEARGAAIVDTDGISRDLMRPGAPLLTKMVAAWGPDILRGDGSLDRAALGRRVFGDPAAVARLNALTHPAILRETWRRVAQSRAPVVVVVVPLLFESGTDSAVDAVWVVTAAVDTRVRRVVARDGISEAAARDRMAAQWDDAQRAARADVIICNDGSREETERQVREAWKCLMVRVGAAPASEEA